jgi:RNA polymerase sigma factor (sigma-70 family)
MSDWETDERWEDLRTTFIDVVQRSTTWRDVWHFLSEHDFYKRQLRSCVRRTMRETGVPMDWLDDIEQEAISLLSRQLQSRRDLHYQPTRPPAEFSRWMRTILFNQSREAIRKIRRKLGRELPLDVDPLDGRVEQIAEEIDVRNAYDQLDEDTRAIMTLHYSGFTLREIANQSGVSYDHVLDVHRKGREKMMYRLQDGYRID